MEMLILITILCIFTFVFALIRIDYKVNEMEKRQEEDMELIKGMLEELNKKTFKPPFDIKTSPRPTPAPFDPFGHVCVYACPTTDYNPDLGFGTTTSTSFNEE